ncbi:type III-B CRISPR module RAMP protein Cmr1 [Pseudothermotoga thermarum]|uniref:type III-B CRISPR module RAMP protein Cmr1 n=1 Tax=Pseudothermotoga thermarum TaxID=119394 RepID=UPI0002E353CC|nr:type III-B CRISPR module RAMP protein Cmr1 [Pseudothermotoga thermarum]
MKRLSFECEIITPMFMSGSDTMTAELRPSEIKGMMRFWWRAARALDDLSSLKKEETEIFGGMDQGNTKSLKSSVSVIIERESLKAGNNILDLINSQQGNNYQGIKYLLYSTFSLKSGGKRLIKGYLKPGSRFKLILSFRDDNDEKIKAVLASFWLAMYLGAFGSRSRRGAGSVNVISHDFAFDFLDFNPKGSTKEELENWYRKNLAEIKKVIQPAKTGRYSNLSKAKIYIADPKPTWIDALEEVGIVFKEYRSKNKGKIFDMAAFGMPIHHNQFSVRLVPYDQKGRISDRFASPLIIKIVRSNGKYFPVLIHLTVDPIFAGKESKDGKRWMTATVNERKKLNFSVIDEFTKEFTKFLNAVVIEYEKL